MSGDTDKLIESLSSGLQPVRPPLSANLTALLWLLTSVGFVLLLRDRTGDSRDSLLRRATNINQHRRRAI